MLSKPDGGCVDGPLSSPPCIFHFFLVLSKTIQALTQPLQPDCGQLQKGLVLRRGLHLGVTPSPMEDVTSEHSLQPLLGTPPLLSLQQFSSFTIDTQHMHTHLCAYTHTRCKYICIHTQVHTGTHRHTKCTRAHKVHTCTQGHTDAHTGTQVGTGTHTCTLTCTMHTRAHRVHIHNTQVHMCTHSYMHTMKTQVHTQAHTHTFIRSSCPRTR